MPSAYTAMCTGKIETPPKRFRDFLTGSRRASLGRSYQTSQHIARPHPSARHAASLTGAQMMIAKERFPLAKPSRITECIGSEESPLRRSQVDSYALSRLWIREPPRDELLRRMRNKACQRLSCLRVCKFGEPPLLWKMRIAARCHVRALSGQIRIARRVYPATPGREDPDLETYTAR
jgi:hypothetical protein